MSGSRWSTTRQPWSGKIGIVQKLTAAGIGAHGIALDAEDELQRGTQRRIVIDDEDGLLVGDVLLVPSKPVGCSRCDAIVR